MILSKYFAASSDFAISRVSKSLVIARIT